MFAWRRVCPVVAISFYLTGTELALIGQQEPEELPEIVSVARRMDMPRREIAGAISVITQDDLNRARQPFVLDALRRMPGLRIARTGGPGQSAKLYLRGAEPRQTVILVDGVSLRSPNDSNGYVLGTLSTANLERIEVLRGPQGSLYGPDAAGGVINIVTKRGSGEPSGLFFLEGGSRDTLKTTLSTSGSRQRLNYAFVADHYETEGVSVARSGTETDPYENDYLQGRLGYALGEGSQLSLLGFRANAFSNADSGASFDSEAATKEKNYLVRAQWELTPMNLDWQSTFGFSRKGFYSEDGFGSYYRGYSTECDLRLVTDFNERLSLGGGVEQIDDRGKQQLAWSPDQAIRLRSWGTYLNGRLETTDDFFTEFAIRRDDNNRYDSETTGRVAFSRSGIGNWRALGSVGTFIVAPNVFYLANAKSLNSLEPETGLGYDFGLERSLGNGRGFASITWFHLETNEQFDWTSWSPSTPSYVVNVDKTKTHGLELELAMDFSDSLALSLAATLQKSRDMTENRDLFSRPEKMFSGTLDWQTPDELVGVHLAFRYIGRRNDATMQPSPSFAVWDLSSTFTVSETMDFHVRIDNVLDNDYTEMVDWNGNGYGTLGRSAFLGVTWRY